MFQANKGFTLIEVIVSIFIIAVAITGLVMGFSYGLAMVEDVQQVSTADNIIQEKMEELRGGITELPSASESPESLPSKEPYSVTVSATSVESALTKVTVTVSWPSHTGRTISRSLVTYFTENGITKTEE